MIMSWHPAIDRWILSQLDNFHLMHPKYSPTAWLVIALSAPVVLIIAWPIYHAAIHNIKHPTGDTLITLGSLSAFGWSIYANITGAGPVYAEVAATVIFLVITGRFLESLAQRRATSALANLLALGSREVSVTRHGKTVLIGIDHLVVGDEFIAKPGERIAADGIVLSGECAVDNSMLTGESTRIGSDTERARISAVFVPVVAAIATGTFLGWHLTHHSLTHSITAAIAVLVIASPSAFALAAPVALLMASGHGTERGIVIRQPRALEVVRKINSVVLDKTGTITGGRMLLLRATVVPGAGEILGARYSDLLNESSILSSALSIESRSEHPVAMAITNYIVGKGINPFDVTDFSARPGTGVAGRVHFAALSPVVLVGSPLAVAHSSTPFHPDLTRAITEAQDDGLTVSVLAWDGVALAAFAIGDEIKPDAANTIAELKRRGVDPWLVTGDAPVVAHAIAKEVGIAIDQVIASALPQQTVDLVKTLQEQNRRVLMVGDGIIDAAALATADLSIAMGTGTDTAIATADITVLGPELASVIDALDLASKTRRVIRLNLLWAFAYNVIALPIAASGTLRPIYAAAAMAFSSVFVVTNSLRIK